MSGEGTFDWGRMFGAEAGRRLPDNAHGQRALAHRRAAARWPAGSALRQMHEAAEASDTRLALAEAAR